MNFKKLSRITDSTNRTRKVQDSKAGDKKAAFNKLIALSRKGEDSFTKYQNLEDLVERAGLSLQSGYELYSVDEEGNLGEYLTTMDQAYMEVPMLKCFAGIEDSAGSGSGSVRSVKEILAPFAKEDLEVSRSGPNSVRLRIRKDGVPTLNTGWGAALADAGWAIKGGDLDTDDIIFIKWYSAPVYDNEEYNPLRQEREIKA